MSRHMHVLWNDVLEFAVKLFYGTGWVSFCEGWLHWATRCTVQRLVAAQLIM